MSVPELGNHALCGQVARLFEDHKHGDMTHEKRIRLLTLLSEVDKRAKTVFEKVGASKDEA